MGATGEERCKCKGVSAARKVGMCGYRVKRALWKAHLGIRKDSSKPTTRNSILEERVQEAEGWYTRHQKSATSQRAPKKKREYKNIYIRKCAKREGKMAGSERSLPQPWSALELDMETLLYVMREG